MKDSSYISYGCNGKFYPKFDKNNFKWCYLFGKMVKVTINDTYYKKGEGKIHFVRTEHGNLRQVPAYKLKN